MKVTSIPVEAIAIEPNVPQQLKMLSPNGGYDLDGQWAFELQDGRVLVANQDLERKINLLELAPGEQFCVAKYNINMKKGDHRG